MSAINSLNKITKKYAENKQKVLLKHLSQDCIDKLGKAKAVVQVNIEEDPTYRIP